MGGLGSVGKDFPQGGPGTAGMQQNGVDDGLRTVLGVIPGGVGQQAIEGGLECVIRRELGGVKQGACDVCEGEIRLGSNLLSRVAYQRSKPGQQERVRPKDDACGGGPAIGGGGGIRQFFHDAGELQSCGTREGFPLGVRQRGDASRDGNERIGSRGSTPKLGGASELRPGVVHGERAGRLIVVKGRRWLGSSEVLA